MKNKIRKTMVVIMTAALFAVTLGVAFSIDVSADGTFNLNAVGDQDVTLKTDGADASYFVVAIPQEIIMTKESESLID